MNAPLTGYDSPGIPAPIESNLQGKLFAKASTL
jgi:hypothetical protein